MQEKPIKDKGNKGKGRKITKDSKDEVRMIKDGWIQLMRAYKIFLNQKI